MTWGLEPTGLSPWGADEEAAVTAPPTLSAVAASLITASGARLTTTASVAGTGTLYVVVYAAALGAPSTTQIAAGNDVNGAPADWDNNGTAWTGSGQQVDASGLTSSTSYKSSAVVYDSGSATYSNVVTSAAFDTLYTHPTLSLATAIDVTATSFKPRVTYTFPS